MNKSIFESIDKVFVINLKHDVERKKSVETQFQKRKLPFEIIEAIGHEDSEVREIYKENRIKSFPPCFRCLKDNCDHENNFLSPKQVANFLSFKKIMEIIKEQKINHTMIFEDDFKFKIFHKKSFLHLEKFIKVNKLLDSKKPLLVRIGCHTIVGKKYYLKFFLLNKTSFIKDSINMANPCFLINYKFAKLFLENFNRIETTSDNFIHRILVRKFDTVNYSMYPFPIKQLSYGNKNNYFKSTINPEKDSNFQFDNINKVTSRKEYNLLLSKWIND